MRLRLECFPQLASESCALRSRAALWRRLGQAQRAPYSGRGGLWWAHFVLPTRGLLSSAAWRRVSTVGLGDPFNPEMLRRSLLTRDPFAGLQHLRQRLRFGEAVIAARCDESFWRQAAVLRERLGIGEGYDFVKR